MIRPNASAVKGTGKLIVEDAAAWAELPNWRRFLLDQTYDDGVTERQPGLVIFRADGSGWHFTLKDVSSCLMLRITGRTWEETLLIAEGFLEDPKAPWETDPYEAGKRARSRGRRS